MKTYKETKKAIKELVLTKGLNNIDGYDILKLINEGHEAINLQKAKSYFQFSKQCEKYRGLCNVYGKL